MNSLRGESRPQSHGKHQRLMQNLYPFSSKILTNTCGLLTKCEVEMTGYWPSSFFASLWTERESRSTNTQKKNEANIKPS